MLVRLVGDKIDHAIRDRDVGCVVGDPQVLMFAEAEFDIPRADAAGVAARHLQAERTACRSRCLAPP